MSTCGMKRGAILPCLVLWGAAVPIDGQTPRPTSPVERAVTALVRSLAMHDAEAFAAATLPHPRAMRLLNREPLSDEAKSEAERRLASLQVRVDEEFLLRGRPAAPDGSGDYPVGTIGHAIAAGQGGPMAVTLVRRPDGWKVDLRWWLAMVDLSEATGPPAEGTTDYAIKRFLLALIGLDRGEALQFAAPGASADLLFEGAPSQREPSGVLEASAMEMPLVEVGPGEFYRLPSGRVVEGSSSADAKVVVGQFGPVEMPFSLRRIDGTWRVEAEPYFVLINR
jgi:hypothetical protein